MKWCCDKMRDEATSTCPAHEHRDDCLDCLVDRWDNGDFGIMYHNDAGGGHQKINFCPWCGAALDTAERAVYVVTGNYDATQCEDEGYHVWGIAVFRSEDEAAAFSKAVMADTAAYLRGEVTQADMLDQRHFPNFDDVKKLWYDVDEVSLDPKWEKTND